MELVLLHQMKCSHKKQIFTMSNVHGLFSNRDKDDDSDSNDESNNRYVGGIGSQGGGSGLAVEPNDRDAVFGRAEQGGSGGGSEDRPRRTITMYRDGFVVDDGPYRRLDDPANADFLRSLAMGRTPRELMEEDVTVGLIDKRQEEYVETFSSFSGQGNSLGTSTADAASADGLIDPTTLGTPPAVDDATPTTSIQVRLANGQRKVIRINTSSTVAHLAAHIGGSEPFRLVSGFPPKPLLDMSQTIADAGLAGAQVMQKSA